MKNTRSFCLIFSVFIMSFLVGYWVLGVWTGPTGTAPTNNAPAPINVSTTAQTKNASLTFKMFYDDDDPSYYVNPSGQSVFSGNVGIGTTSPDVALHVADIDTVGIKYIKSGSKDARIQIGDQTKTWGLAVGWATAGDFSIIEEGVAGDRLYIKQGGNVGIGTTDPGTNKLQVQGNVKVQGDVEITGSLKTGVAPGKIEGTSVVFTPGSVPGSPTKGQMYWNNVTDALYFYNGTSWQKVSGTAQAYCQAYPGTPDDANCGTIDCSGWYVQTGVESASDTEYCYNKTNITTNRCEGVDDCKDSNTADCDPQANNALQYSCGICKYISASSCTGTTLGSCTTYPNATSCSPPSGGTCMNGTCVRVFAKLSSGCNSACSGVGLSCIGTSSKGNPYDGFDYCAAGSYYLTNDYCATNNWVCDTCIDGGCSGWCGSINKCSNVLTACDSSSINCFEHFGETGYLRKWVNCYCQ